MGVADGQKTTTHIANTNKACRGAAHDLRTSLGGHTACKGYACCSSTDNMARWRQILLKTMMKFSSQHAMVVKQYRSMLLVCPIMRAKARKLGAGSMLVTRTETAVQQAVSCHVITCHTISLVQQAVACHVMSCHVVVSHLWCSSAAGNAMWSTQCHVMSRQVMSLVMQQ